VVGTKDFRYYVSGDFMKQQGAVKGYQYKRANLRANLDATITDYLTIGTTISYTNNNYDGGRANFYLATAMSPYGLFVRCQWQLCHLPHVRRIVVQKSTEWFEQRPH
jgi:hypothetical protein